MTFFLLLMAHEIITERATKYAEQIKDAGKDINNTGHLSFETIKRGIDKVASSGKNLVNIAQSSIITPAVSSTKAGAEHIYNNSSSLLKGIGGAAIVVIAISLMINVIRKSH